MLRIRTAQDTGTSDWAQVLHYLEHIHNVVVAARPICYHPSQQKRCSACRAKSNGALRAAQNAPWRRAVNVLIPIAVSRSDTGLAIVKDIGAAEKVNRQKWERIICNTVA